jgi:hypothetical protein
MNDDDRFDPVHSRFIEALTRRAATYDGAVRCILDAKVAKLLMARGEHLATGLPPPRAPVADQEQSDHRGPLGELVDRIAQRALSPDPKTLEYFRSTWATLSTNQQLTRSLATVPKNAGPLNSHHLVHRSLTLMRELSPEYLTRFMSYVDGLSWLEQAHEARAAMGMNVQRSPGLAMASTKARLKRSGS